MEAATTTLAVRNTSPLGSTNDHQMLGAEIALVAVLVSASISKQRDVQKKAELADKGWNLELGKMSDCADDISHESPTISAQYKALTRPTWLVRDNEDLVKLAEHLFQESELGHLIADINIGRTKVSYMDGKRVVELRARQRIDLPVWQDIVDFHKNYKSNTRSENLVTVVMKSAVDAALINATLGLAMGIAYRKPRL